LGLKRVVKSAICRTCQEFIAYIWVGPGLKLCLPAVQVLKTPLIVRAPDEDRSADLLLCLISVTMYFLVQETFSLADKNIRNELLIEPKGLKRLGGILFAFKE
jgi:hypothetical protein